MHYATGVYGLDRDGNILDLRGSMSSRRDTEPLIVSLELVRHERRLQVTMSHGVEVADAKPPQKLSTQTEAPMFGVLKSRRFAGAVDLVIGPLYLWEGEWTVNGSLRKRIVFALHLDEETVVGGDFEPPSLPVLTIETPGLTVSEALGAVSDRDPVVYVPVDKGWTAMDRGADAGPISADVEPKKKPEFARFSIKNPHGLSGWHRNLETPVAWKDYPILVLRYRARNLAVRYRWYHLWIDDGTGPFGGGGIVFWPRDVVSDGEIHELRKDLRQLKLRGPNVTRLVLAMRAADKAAEYDLYELRFEAQ